jgi:hypothetical protein
MNVRSSIACLLLLVVAASCSEDKAAQCALQLGETSSMLQAADRKIVGIAVPYAADLSLHAREAELGASLAQRRAVAWQVVERVLAPVPLGEARLADNFGGAQPTVPAWHTWYGKDDFERLFKKLYGDIGPDGRAERRAFDDASIAAAIEWNIHAVEDLPTWPEERYLEYLDAADEVTEPGGFAGISRVGYSPGALRHMLEGYARTYQCRLADEPPAYAPDAVKEGRDVVATDDVVVEGCEWKTLGPYLVADDSQLTVTLSGSGDADLYVRRGAPPDDQTYDCRSQGGSAAESCTVAGGGAIYVAVLGFGDGAELAVETRYREADVRDPTCVDGEFPRDAVVIKADWKRADFGETLPIYNTTGPRMTTRLRADGTFDWGPGDGFADPQEADIYKVKVPSGGNFRLAALHIMTKELEHWLWITLWFSDDPDSDFGADRPASIAGLGPWRNYKMCVATGYLEGDPDPTGGFTGTLGEALASVHGGLGTPTWCSNPYLEVGAGNADTNCIGCHQHGGRMQLTPEEIISNEIEFPHHGRARVRNNFFTDYSWAVQGGRGDDLASVIQAEIEYWDANDP